MSIGRGWKRTAIHGARARIWIGWPNQRVVCHWSALDLMQHSTQCVGSDATQHTGGTLQEEKDATMLP